MAVAPTTHSRKYSPSKSGTWLNCPLSTLLNDSSNQEPNLQALFGTQTHELGAALICKSLKLVDYEQEQKSIDDVIKGLDMYSDEMQELADAYADFVINLVEFETKRSTSKPVVVVEQHLDMDFDEDAGGTLDCGIISDANGGTLTVIDLKTGRIKVNTYDADKKQFNSQLGIYALYLYKAYKDLYPIKNIRLAIFQPTVYNTNFYEMPLDELLVFEKDVLIPAVEASKLDNPKAKSGAYCKWCAGKALCKERADSCLSLVQEVSSSIAMLTDAEIEKLLPELDNIIQFATDVKEFALKKALKGHKWSNFKLVHGKTTRKIENEEAVIKVCEDEGIDPYIKKLAGITELTKRIGKERFNDLVGMYITKQVGTITLVPSSDDREEVTIIKGDYEDA